MGKFGQFPVVVVSIRSCSLICSLYLCLSIEIARGVGMPPFLKDGSSSCQLTLYFIVSSNVQLMAQARKK